MIFSSLLFLFRFLPIVVLIYYVAPHKFKNFVLFASSLLFYSWGEPVYVLLMIFSTLVDYVHGMLVYKFKSTNQMTKAKLALTSSVVINLGLLGFFKYADFFIGSINNVFGLDIAFLQIALPIGISFYTFQTMSYSLDIYMSDEKPQKNIISFGTYVALFPQLIAGPIVRYNEIAYELEHRKENIDDFFIGIRYFMIGMGKKVLLANNIGIVWDGIKATDISRLTTVTAWIGIIAYAFQIYFDFSGYSDMAIGLGRMFGFKFPINFNYPYISKSITEFWRRWHISLSSWFKEYLYIPLGGNRCSKLKNYRNIFIVWFLTGFWHGAAYNFILWGIYFAIILMAEKAFMLKVLEKIPAFFRHTYAILLILVGWVIFEFESVADIVSYVGAMFGIGTSSFVDMSTLYLLKENIIMLVILMLASTPIPKIIISKLFFILQNSNKFFRSSIPYILENGFNIMILVVSTAYLVDASYNPFLYFRF